MSSWLVPTLGYVFAMGALGITSKLALRGLEWPQLILWGAGGYVVAAAILAARGSGVELGSGTLWAALSGVCLIVASVLLFVALERGDASMVVPIGSMYPAVTVLLAAVFLAEAVSTVRLVGLGLVLAGVVLLAR